MHPQRQPGVAGRVAGRARRRERNGVSDGALDRAVEAVQAGNLPARLAGGPEHDAEIAPEGALQAAPGIRPEVAVLVNALGDEGMGDLHQQRSRAGAEEQHRLPVEPP